MTGSKHLGKILRRRAEGIPESVMRGDGGKPKHDGWLIGDVVAWLPAHQSNFFKDPMTKQEPAALWRVIYREIVAGAPQEEELEEAEVVEGHKAYQAWKSALLDKDEWLVTGSDYLKARVRKTVASLDGGVYLVNATVSGWLPPELSNFFPDPATQVPVALWRILFDDETIGAEDLEEAEVVEYMMAYNMWKKTEDLKKRSQQGKGSRASSSPSKRRCGGLERKASEGSAHAASGEGGDAGEQGKKAAQKDLPPAKEGSGKSVQELRGRKKTPDGKVMYLAHWSGTASDDDSWVEASQLGKDEWLVSEWEQEHAQEGAAEAGSGEAAADGGEVGEAAAAAGAHAAVQQVGNTMSSGVDEHKAQARKRPRESQDDIERTARLSAPERSSEESGTGACPAAAQERAPAASALEQAGAGDGQGGCAGGGAGGRGGSGSARSPEPAVTGDGQGGRSKRPRRSRKVSADPASDSE